MYYLCIIIIDFVNSFLAFLAVGNVEEENHGWIEGVAILIAVVIVVLVTAFNDWDRFYKTLFRPTFFRTNFHPQILDQFPLSNFGQISLFKFWSNFHPKNYNWKVVLVLWIIILDFVVF
jgi:hypothetical protein